jgi:hypothetical protein
MGRHWPAAHVWPGVHLRQFQLVLVDRSRDACSPLGADQAVPVDFRGPLQRTHYVRSDGLVAACNTTFLFHLGYLRACLQLWYPAALEWLVEDLQLCHRGRTRRRPHYLHNYYLFRHYFPQCPNPPVVGQCRSLQYFG